MKKICFIRYILRDRVLLCVCSMTRIIIRESFDCKVGPDKVFGLDKEEFAELLSGRELTRFVSDEYLESLGDRKYGIYKGNIVFVEGQSVEIRLYSIDLDRDLSIGEADELVVSDGRLDSDISVLFGLRHTG